MTIYATNEQSLKTAIEIVEKTKTLWGHKVTWGPEIIAGHDGVVGARLENTNVTLNGVVTRDGEFRGEIIIPYDTFQIIADSSDEQVMEALAKNDFRVDSIESGPLAFYTVFIGENGFVAKPARLGTVLRIVSEKDASQFVHIDLDKLTIDEDTVRYNDENLTVVLKYRDVVYLDKLYSKYRKLAEDHPGIVIESPARGTVHAVYNDIRVRNVTPTTLQKILNMIDEYSKKPKDGWQIDKGEVHLLDEKKLSCNLRRNNVVCIGAIIEKGIFGRWKVHLHKAFIKIGEDVLSAKPREVDVLFELFEKETGNIINEIILHREKTVYRTSDGHEIVVKRSNKK